MNIDVKNEIQKNAKTLTNAIKIFFEHIKCSDNNFSFDSTELEEAGYIEIVIYKYNLMIIISEVDVSFYGLKEDTATNSMQEKIFLTIDLQSETIFYCCSKLVEVMLKEEGMEIYNKIFPVED